MWPRPPGHKQSQLPSRCVRIELPSEQGGGPRAPLNGADTLLTFSHWRRFATRSRNCIERRLGVHAGGFERLCNLSRYWGNRPSLATDDHILR